MRFTPMVCAVALGLTATSAMAQQTLFEIDAGASYDWRGGNDLNSSGPPLREIPEYELGSISGLAAVRFDNDIIVQGRLRYDRSFAETWLSSGPPSGDTYKDGRELALQAGQNLGNYYLGAYAAVGQVGFNPWDDVQDASFQSLGVQAAWYGENWSLGGVLGTLDSSADDPETIDNAVLVGLTGSYHFNGGDTQLNASLTKFMGEQDIDSGSSPDPLDVWAASVEIEHLVREGNSYALAVYGGLQWIEARENSSGGGLEIVNDRILTAGLRVRFGTQAKAKGPGVKTPALPDMLRVIGAVPAVD